MNEIKLCPLLIQKEEHKALTYGSGDFTVSYLLPCIKDKCVSYKNGYCNHFCNEVGCKNDR